MRIEREFGKINYHIIAQSERNQGERYGEAQDDFPEFKVVSVSGGHGFLVRRFLWNFVCGRLAFRQFAGTFARRLRRFETRLLVQKQPLIDRISLGEVNIC